MTQLSNDIARGVGGISAVRHHGMRTKKRKTRHQAGVEPHFAKEYSRNRPSRESREDRTASGSKRLIVGPLPPSAPHRTLPRPTTTSSSSSLHNHIHSNGVSFGKD